MRIYKHFNKNSSMTLFFGDCKKMLKECMRYQAPIIVNSDAHADFLVGEHTEAMALLEEVGFPEELVVNTNLDLYFSYLSVNPIYLD